MNIPNIFRNLGHNLNQNSPVLLTALGVAGVIGTAYLAHEAGRRATNALADEKVRRSVAEGGDYDWTLTAKETVDLTWRFYIPTALMGAATLTCVIGSNAISSRRQAALLSGLTLSQQALTEYRDKVSESIGENKAKKLTEELSVEKAQAGDYQGEDIVLPTGQVLCHEELTGRYFPSDQETLRRAMNDINEKCIKHGYASLNEFWNIIGLETTTLGSMMGFNVDTTLELDFVSFINRKGVPVLSYRFHHTPSTDYANTWR